MEELFDKIFFRALQKHTTDIHLVLKGSLMIHFRIFGQLEFYDELDYEKGSHLLNYLKYKASINTNHRLKPQTGHCICMINGKELFLRLSYLPSSDFESIVIRILNNHESLTIDELTKIPDISSFLYDVVSLSSGLILISGATGSGKSTTLYTLLDEIVKTQKKNIVTIEDPIEMRKSGCLQIELNEKLGITYESTLKQILRHDPDVIMIGEVRDAKTAQIAITCALTGHLVLTTIHASCSYLALKRLENLGISEVDLQDVVVGSLSQKIKYDFDKKEVIVLSELMRKKDIQNFFENKPSKYLTFKENAKYLIKEHGYNQKMFEGEINE